MREVVFLAALAIASLPLAAGADDSATLTVSVATFRSTKGNLGCRVYASADGFPSKPTHLAQQLVPVVGATTSCTFGGLRPGTYAVAVFHDENGNGKMDTNFLGIPSEGYGASNNHSHAMSAPTFDESKFILPAGAATINVTLHY